MQAFSPLSFVIHHSVTKSALMSVSRVQIYLKLCINDKDWDDVTWQKHKTASIQPKKNWRYFMETNWTRDIEKEQISLKFKSWI